MRCKILHESKGRMRVHMHQCNMTVHEADKLLYYLEELDFVKKAEVNERTANAIIYYKGEREQVIEALSVFNYETTEVIVPEHTGRELRVQFEDKMFFLITRRLISKFILPPPIQMIKNVIQAVPFVIEGVKSILKGKVEVSVLDATSITVSIIRKDFETSGSVIFLLKVGELIENYTHRKSVDDLARKMSLNVDKVWIKTADEQEILVNTFDVKEGDVVVIRTGTMIPLDGIIESGEASINQASMTGESEAVRKDKGDLVYAGTVVEEGEIFVRVQKAQGAGRYDRIVAMIEESEKLKSATEDKASHLADRLVPYTLGSTLLTYLITRNATKAASILMVDFCCALKLSMPIAVLSAMRESGEYKISVKGGKFMEAVAEAETIVFDKTGTLTHAVPRVKRVIPFDGNDEAEMLRLAACLEEHYPHSIANAVVKTAEERGLFHEEKHTKAIYVVAHGIASTINGEKVCIGSHHYIFDDERCIVPPGETDKFDELPNEYSHLYMAIDNRLAAVILIEDPLREEAASVVEKLKKVGFSKVVMMTGDNERTARDVALKTGVTDYFSEVLPEDKAAFIRKEHEAGRKVIMIGDGINDSPALSEADAGIAVSSGASIAREIADITISSDNLEALLTLREISTRLMDRIRFNYRTIIGFNSGLILLGILGVLAPTGTALLHNASTVAISLKSMTDLMDSEKK
ncbi:heavy metal translocating P-type ATPase [Lachnobacterium bovis]|uniref:Cd(2+)-exporting ATPase n=1 Tax=Lachnobacterium bovis DSM 14045 TaxID=1122142 RepID=A0A1H3KU27_9FIRM|nr:heavy metal translocating P-type ATPase [Lachnobacterium bovis]SDY55717.1 ATPase, P-type (transporting), HAD superfamily, subfamily IC/heavy metal translocating P-type ATPase [Lachnobacterium bovis DSM 14045]